MSWENPHSQANREGCSLYWGEWFLCFPHPASRKEKVSLEQGEGSIAGGGEGGLKPAKRWLLLGERLAELERGGWLPGLTFRPSSRLLHPFHQGRPLSFLVYRKYIEGCKYIHIDMTRCS